MAETVAATAWKCFLVVIGEYNLFIAARQIILSQLFVYHFLKPYRNPENAPFEMPILGVFLPFS